MDVMAVAQIGMSMQAQQLRGSLEVAALGKTMDVQRQQGQAALKLLEAAAAVVADPSRGTRIDVQA